MMHVSNEICWNISTGEDFENIVNYLHQYKDRRDEHAQKMRGTLSKEKMKSMILGAQNSVHSIRIGATKDLISLDYKDPISVHSIEGFSVFTESTVIRGDAITESVTKHKSHSYSSLLFSSKNHKGKSTTTSRTTHQPDRVVKKYELNIVIENPYYNIIKMVINDNSSVIQRIVLIFRSLGIKQIC